MTHASRSSLAPLLALLQVSTGCSFAFMTRPPEPVAEPSAPVACTSSRAAPMLDTVCAALFLTGAVSFASGPSHCNEQNSTPGGCIADAVKTPVVVTSLGLAVLCGLSAISGYGKATRCEAVKGANALCITGDEAACRTLNPAWTPPMKFPAAAPEAPPAGAP